MKNLALIFYLFGFLFFSFSVGFFVGKAQAGCCQYELEQPANYSYECSPSDQCVGMTGWQFYPNLVCYPGSLSCGEPPVAPEPLPEIEVPPIDSVLLEPPTTYEPVIPEGVDLLAPVAPVYCTTCDKEQDGEASCIPVIEGTNTTVNTSNSVFKQTNIVCKNEDCPCGTAHNPAFKCKTEDKIEYKRTYTYINGIQRWIGCNLTYKVCNCTDR